MHSDWLKENNQIASIDHSVNLRSNFWVDDLHQLQELLSWEGNNKVILNMAWPWTASLYSRTCLTTKSSILTWISGHEGLFRWISELAAKAPLRNVGPRLIVMLENLKKRISCLILFHPFFLREKELYHGFGYLIRLGKYYFTITHILLVNCLTLALLLRIEI